MEDPGLFTLPCRLGDSKPFDTFTDLGSCVNIIPLYLFKKLNIGLLEETGHIFRLADGTKSYPVGIVKDVEVYIGKLKLLNDFYVIDMKKDPETPLLVGKGFLAITIADIDCRMAKIVVGEGITRKDFLDCHLPEEWEIVRDAELNPFKDTLVFRRMIPPVLAGSWEQTPIPKNLITLINKYMVSLLVSFTALKPFENFNQGYATQAGFYHSRCDSSLLIYTRGSHVAYLLIYVDDINLTASSSVLLQQIIDSLYKEFDMTYLGALDYFHGISAARHSTVSTDAKFSPNRVPKTPWVRNLLRELHSSLLIAMLVYCDNVSAVYMYANPVQHERMKHIEIDIHFIRDMVTAGYVRVLHVPSRF
ncbi:copia protein [Tanacetum coccineum]